MSEPPRNKQLERMLIDVLRATSPEAPDRHAAWEVYADWLLGVGEPIGEWLAASLRADDDAEAAAPIRAQLGEIERACRFRLFDNELADLSEVPELTRIAEFTWERGFITVAAVHGRRFRAFDSELLGHTPDRLLDVVLRSPSSRMLHTLELDRHAFVAKGSRWPDLSALLAALPEPLLLRSLSLGHADSELRLGPRVLAQLPELTKLELDAGFLHVAEPLALDRLESLRVRIGPSSTTAQIGAAGRPHTDPVFSPSRFEDFGVLLEAAGVPALRRLELGCAGADKSLVEGLAGCSLLPRLEQLQLERVNEAMVAGVLREQAAFAHLREFVVGGVWLSPNSIAALQELGCRVSS